MAATPRTEEGCEKGCIKTIPLDRTPTNSSSESHLQCQLPIKSTEDEIEYHDDRGFDKSEATPQKHLTKQPLKRLDFI